MTLDKCFAESKKLQLSGKKLAYHSKATRIIYATNASNKRRHMVQNKTTTNLYQNKSKLKLNIVKILET